jgi:nucleoside-diphosphate-sugar epimerase
VVHRLAAAGCQVVAASRSGGLPEAPFEEPPLSGEVRPLALDVAAESAVDVLRAEVATDVAVVHLAAWHPPATAASTPGDRARLIAVNVMGTMRVLDAVRAAGGARIVVYASTFEVYGVPPDAAPVTEDSPTRPFSDYGATKLSGEDHLFAFAAEQGISAVALRLPAIYGPGERVSRALPNFLRAVARGERPKVYGTGLDRRDQLHAADAALGVECALVSVKSGVYNVADGEPHSVLDLARAALGVAERGDEPEHVPAQAQKPSFDFHMSIDKIRSQLGFDPRVRLADGMRQQLRWIRSLGDERA